MLDGAPLKVTELVDAASGPAPRAVLGETAAARIAQASAHCAPHSKRFHAATLTDLQARTAPLGSHRTA